MAAVMAKKSFLFLLLDEFSIISLASGMEALRLANEASGRELFTWRKVSENGDPVCSDSGVVVEVEGALDHERSCSPSHQADVFVICGGLKQSRIRKSVRSWVREGRLRGATICSLGGATVGLAETGLLDGKTCVVHWLHEPEVSERFHRIEIQNQIFASDGGIYTGAGGQSTFDLFLEMIAKDLEPPVLSRICEYALAPTVRRRSERQRTPLQVRVGSSNAVVLRAVELMEQNFSEPFDLKRMTAAIGISRRQLERLFSAELGRPPGRYYREIRLERAHLLLSACALPVVEVAAACGFTSPSHFSRCYREMFDCSAVETRERAAAKRERDAVLGKFLRPDQTAMRTRKRSLASVEEVLF